MKWKKYLFFCSAAMLIGLLSTGCSEALDGSSPDAPGVSLRLVAGQAAATRAGTDIQSKAFDAGETVNVYITAKKTSADDIIVGAPTVCTTMAPVSNQNELTPDAVPYFPQDDGYKLDIYALYPSTVSSGESTFSVQADQTSDDAYKGSDLMYASLSNVARTATPTTTANLPFDHKMVKLIVKTIITDGATVGSVTSVSLKGVYRRIGFTPATGVLDAAGLADQGDIVFNSTSAVTTDESACLFPPQSIQRGDFLEVVTTNGTATFALALTAAKAFEAGHVYKVEINLSAQNLRETATIDAWDADKNLKVDPLGEGNIQIDEIADVDPSDASTFVLNTTTTPYSYEPSSVTVRSNGNALTLGTDYTLEYFNNTAAGDYAVVLATGIGTYAGKTAARSYLIKAGAITYNPEPVAATGLVYDGTAKNLVANAPHAFKSSGPEVTIKYCLTEKGFYSTTLPTATNAGNYTVWYKVDDTDGFSGIAPRSFSVTIAKATIASGDVTAPTANVLTYNERYQTLVTAGSVTGEGVMTYCLGTNATSAPASGYKTDIPVAHDAGTYYVWWMVGDDNHDGTTPQCVTVTMAKAPGRINLDPAAVLFDVSDRKDSKKIVTVDRAGDGAITASITSGSSHVSQDVNGVKVSLTRLTEAEATATVRVSVAEGTNHLAVSADCAITLRKPYIHLSNVKSTDQKFLGYLVSTTGYIYPPTDEGEATLVADGGTAAGIITYLGTTNTTHGFVMALHDCIDGATVDFDTAPATAAAYTPTISGYSWILGSEQQHRSALNQLMKVFTIALGHWDYPSGDHWTATYEWDMYLGWEWIYDGEIIRQNHRNYSFVSVKITGHIDNCKVRSIIAF